MKKVRIIPPIPKEYKKLKVAAYCRVSTFRPIQLHSLEMQIKTYKPGFRTNPISNVNGIKSISKYFEGNL